MYVRMLKRSLLSVCAIVMIGSSANTPSDIPYLDDTLPALQRAQDLVSRMTLDEKIGQLQVRAPAIPRLHVPAYMWWSEALHGINANNSTQFPQAIALAATWDPSLMHKVAEAISMEARAHYEHQLRLVGSTSRDSGLTIFAPNVNIVRDPRWGRAQETYGEDPFLTTQFGIAYVTGLQGDNPYFYRTIATLKHFAVHSGPEVGRPSFDARVSRYDLSDTYLTQFEQITRVGRPGSIMTSYNAINGIPASADKPLLDLARSVWGFSGYFVSDCDAVANIYDSHHFASSAPEASADALRAGLDLNCGHTFSTLSDAVNQGLVAVTDIDAATVRLFMARIRLGMFDPGGGAYGRIPEAEIDKPSHRNIALKAAQESLVLLRNEYNLLPLNSRHVRTLAVVGPNAEYEDVLLGDYNGFPSHPVTILGGLLSRAQAAGIRVSFAPGGSYAETDGSETFEPRTNDVYIEQAIRAAREADAVVLVVGDTPDLEEEGIGDRSAIELPPAQERLVRAVVRTGKPVVLVVTGGSAIAIPYEATHVAAILYAWYSGEEGGTAIAQALFGDVSPSGRLPLTIYRATSQLPPFADYSMRGRTYRYFEGNPLYPFGYGLSYTTFRYSGLRVENSHPSTGEPLYVKLNVQNTGMRTADDVVELYVSLAATLPAAPHPIRSLAGLAHITLRPNESRTVRLKVEPFNLTLVDADGERFEIPGEVSIAAGGQQPSKGNAYASTLEGQRTTTTIYGSKWSPQR